MQNFSEKAHRVAHCTSLCQLEREPRSLISGPGFHSDESHEGDEGGCESFCTLREHQMIASCDQVLV